MGECDELLPGQRVKLSTTKHPGVVRYVGLTDFSDGIWVGVELDDPVGSNDGTIRGEAYFSCKPKHGIFVRSSKLALDSQHAKDGRKVSSSGVRHSIAAPVTSPAPVKPERNCGQKASEELAMLQAELLLELQGLHSEKQVASPQQQEGCGTCAKAWSIVSELEDEVSKLRHDLVEEARLSKLAFVAAREQCAAANADLEEMRFREEAQVAAQLPTPQRTRRAGELEIRNVLASMDRDGREDNLAMDLLERPREESQSLQAQLRCMQAELAESQETAASALSKAACFSGEKIQLESKLLVASDEIKSEAQQVERLKAQLRAMEAESTAANAPGQLPAPCSEQPGEVTQRRRISVVRKQGEDGKIVQIRRRSMPALSACGNAAAAQSLPTTGDETVGVTK